MKGGRRGRKEKRDLSHHNRLSSQHSERSHQHCPRWFVQGLIQLQQLLEVHPISLERTQHSYFSYLLSPLNLKKLFLQASARMLKE